MWKWGFWAASTFMVTPRRHYLKVLEVGFEDMSGGLHLAGDLYARFPELRSEKHIVRILGTSLKRSAHRDSHIFHGALRAAANS